MPWIDWAPVARKLYEATFKGWPVTEFRRYHAAGMSPLSAYEAAFQKRKTARRFASRGAELSSNP